MARLPRLRRNDAIVEGDLPSFRFQKDWQTVVEAAEGDSEKINDLETAILVIQARLTAAGIP